MISDSFLKLAVATFIGGAIYYKYSKKKVKKTEIHKSDSSRGKIAPNHKIEAPDDVKKKAKQQLKKALKPTHLFRK